MNTRYEAWLGDALLALYARELLIEKQFSTGYNIGLFYSRMTSNLVMADFCQKILDKNWTGTQFEIFVYSNHQLNGVDSTKELVNRLFLFVENLK
jgi:hypothetical protein